MANCTCKDWVEHIEKVTGPGAAMAIRYGTSGYDGVLFRFCPWCASALDYGEGAGSSQGSSVGTPSAGTGEATGEIQDGTGSEASPGAGTPLTEPVDADLQPFGWAPGGYSCWCLSCRKMHQDSDKRSLVCRPCAVQRFKAPKAELARPGAGLPGPVPSPNPLPEETPGAPSRGLGGNRIPLPGAVPDLPGLTTLRIRQALRYPLHGSQGQSDGRREEGNTMTSEEKVKRLWPGASIRRITRGYLDKSEWMVTIKPGRYSYGPMRSIAWRTAWDLIAQDDELSKGEQRP